MAASTLTIKDLHVEIEGKEILKGVNLEIKGGEFHAVMARTELVNPHYQLLLWGILNMK